MDENQKKELTPKQIRLTVFNYLFNKYEKRGYKDFPFVIKNLARDLELSPYQILGSVVKFRDLDMVFISISRSKRDLWKTNFSGKSRGVMEPEAIRI